MELVLSVALAFERLDDWRKLLMVPKSAHAHLIKSWVVPNGDVARKRVKVSQSGAL